MSLGAFYNSLPNVSLPKPFSNAEGEDKIKDVLMRINNGEYITFPFKFTIGAYDYTIKRNGNTYTISTQYGKITDYTYEQPNYNDPQPNPPGTLKGGYRKKHRTNRRKTNRRRSNKRRTTRRHK